ncbi:MAG TPA: hypothetical protein VFH88_06590, partial [Candidatus Krumholzibacteria bacterium]|nr:hypothetical protein [Candidatus Krumholzibacteria bacterium]
MEQERLAVCAPRRCARIFLATTLIALAAALPARAAEVGWGLAAGYPQVFAVVAETPQHGPLRMQFSVSPMIFMNSMTARAILSPLTTRLRPYAFLGAGILNTNEGDGG